MKHDRLFKELLTSFFYQFLELFFGDLAELIDRSHAPIFLDKESFGELPGDSRREKDLVVRVRLHSGEACFIVHIEHEAQNNSDFPQRMHLCPAPGALRAADLPHRRLLEPNPKAT